MAKMRMMLERTRSRLCHRARLEVRELYSIIDTLLVLEDLELCYNLLICICRFCPAAQYAHEISIMVLSLKLPA